MKEPSDEPRRLLFEVPSLENAITNSPRQLVDVGVDVGQSGISITGQQIVDNLEVGNILVVDLSEWGTRCADANPQRTILLLEKTAKFRAEDGDDCILLSVGDYSEGGGRIEKECAFRINRDNNRGALIYAKDGERLQVGIQQDFDGLEASLFRKNLNGGTILAETADPTSLLMTYHTFNAIFWDLGRLTIHRLRIITSENELGDSGHVILHDAYDWEAPNLLVDGIEGSNIIGLPRSVGMDGNALDLANYMANPGYFGDVWYELNVNLVSNVEEYSPCPLISVPL